MNLIPGVNTWLELSPTLANFGFMYNLLWLQPRIECKLNTLNPILLPNILQNHQVNIPADSSPGALQNIRLGFRLKRGDHQTETRSFLPVKKLSWNQHIRIQRKAHSHLWRKRKNQDPCEKAAGAPIPATCDRRSDGMPATAELSSDVFYSWMCLKKKEPFVYSTWSQWLTHLICFNVQLNRMWLGEYMTCMPHKILQ